MILMKEKSPNEKTEYERRKRKYVRKVKRSAFLLKIVTIIRVLYWSIYFYFRTGLVNREYIRRIDSPWKLYAFFQTNFSIDFTDRSMEIHDLNYAIKRRILTEKNLVYLMSALMSRHHPEVYIFWCGHRAGFLKPVMVLIWGDLNLSIGWNFRVHSGGHFEIMKSYFRDGTAWYVLDSYGHSILMDYEKDRIETGIPDIVVRDMNHWMKSEPTVTHLARQWNLVLNNVDILKPNY